MTSPHTILTQPIESFLTDAPLTLIDIDFILDQCLHGTESMPRVADTPPLEAEGIIDTELLSIDQLIEKFLSEPIIETGSMEQLKGYPLYDPCYQRQRPQSYDLQHHLDDLVTFVPDGVSEEESSQRYKLYIALTHREHKKLSYYRKKQREHGLSTALKTRKPMRVFHPCIKLCSAYTQRLSQIRIYKQKRRAKLHV